MADTAEDEEERYAADSNDEEVDCVEDVTEPVGTDSLRHADNDGEDEAKRVEGEEAVDVDREIEQANSTGSHA